MPGFHVTTLGCKLNQFDSAELSGALRAAGMAAADPGSALLLVVNTCTVTAEADADARQLLRRRRRENPAALVVATGCYAERDPEALRRLPEVDLVITRHERPRASALIIERLRRRFPVELGDGCADRALEETLPDFGDRTRAFLRVQEGCDLRCTYCVIPRVRGASRSLPPDDVERRFRMLLDAGYREIVLTGVNTGDYGKDLDPRLDLASLVRRLARLPGSFRVRLNSVEPRCVTADLIDLMASEEKIARHLQVPLQSGSDEILRAMRRNYRSADYLRTAEALLCKLPDLGLGADVIVGFPGETDEQAERTAEIARRIPLSYMHVFSYSVRPGTPAGDLGGRLPPAVVKSRSRRLRSIGRQLSEDFKRSQVGRPLGALVLQGRTPDGRARALTTNFIEVALEGRVEENTLLDVVITGLGAPGMPAPARPLFSPGFVAATW